MGRGVPSASQYRPRLARGRGTLAEAYPGGAPLTFEGPVTFRIEFAYAAIADDYCVIPGTRRIAPRVVECTGEDFRAAYRLGYATLAAVLHKYDS